LAKHWKRGKYKEIWSSSVFEHRKGEKNIKEKKNKRGWSPKPMLQKPDPLVSKIRTFGFSWTDLIWLGIEILFVLKRFSGIRVKELHHVAYKHIGRDRLTTMPIEFIQFY
jgi:hypothetical protein